MNNNFDFSTKELVESLSYTTSTKDRQAEVEVVIDGRKYIKQGTLQAVTVVGNIYKDHKDNKIIMVGISKQHPDDLKCDKHIGYEEANLRALENPDIIIYNVPKYVTIFNFEMMMSWYVDMMDLKFVRTKQEIEKNMSEKNNE